MGVILFCLINPLVRPKRIMKRLNEIVQWWLKNGIGLSKEQLWQVVHNDLMLEIEEELRLYYMMHCSEISQ